ncbi:MAG TPA: NAD-glutamate dehydrogenase [Caulobacteraceae bacterium]
MPTAAPASDTPEINYESLSQAFAKATGGAAGDETQAKARQAFIARILEDYRPEELPGLSATDFAATLAGFWRFGEAHASDSPSARLVRAQGQGGGALGADLLEIVQPDAPFLVDSIMGEVGESGVGVKAMFHPIVERGDERVSLIQIWLDPVAAERRAALLERVLAVLAEVHVAVADFPAMLALMARSITELAVAAPGDPEALAEDLAFLRWIDAGHFVFLGARIYDYPRAADGGYAAEEPLYQPERSLGVLRDPARAVLRRASEPAVLSAVLRRRLETAEPVVVAKSNLRSSVHRRVYMDYVGVRRYGADGKPSGEVRFVGLFTAQAYDEPARDTPMLRRKLDEVMRATGFAPGSHNALRLANILETYPRDELFQIGSQELLTTALGILHLSDRPRVRLFARRDPFDRFVSILLFAPRERYDARLRERAGSILAKAFDGRVSAYYPSYTDAPLARVHYIIGVTPGRHGNPDLGEVEALIARAARTWADDLEDAVRDRVDPARVSAILATWAGAFPAGYRDKYDADETIEDLLIAEVLRLSGAIEVRAYRRADDSNLRFHFKLYRRGEHPAPLTQVIPILEHMGLKALVEEGFLVTPGGPQGTDVPVWIHEFVLQDDHGEHLVFDDVRSPFEAAFKAVWSGASESDGFNRLVLELGVSWREAALVRALAGYRQQSGLDPTQPVQETALSAHSDVARLILELFRLRFDPGVAGEPTDRDTRAVEIRAAIEEALQAVESLDADRVLRRLAALVCAITRTNYYQNDAEGRPKSYISFKLASRELVDLPPPKPFSEIFVSAPNVEGVHLRFGPVARGGLRWSDRRDDYRTEVLGLVKAQQVKNAVIVPVGAKGGFYPKLPPRAEGQDAVLKEAIGAYRTFLKGLLDLTDTIDAGGAVVHPAGVVVHDGEDPYLVVAADKGTAAFSDIANEVAAEYGFWLGDAFASGGSAGYDHKVMGITARGAWESIKRHFREMGRDIQSEPFTVTGVGDMSGDVFGNGMLLSRKIRLQAAFDHRHIFLDPDPDPGASWKERKRLFALPRSSWDDYDRERISEGGGVYPRTLKAIELTEPVKTLLDVKASSLSPAELIGAILKARVDLLYLGGIGTYVKATGQANLDVGDKANDAVRVNGADLRCKVVGEGANLGFTQAGRIEFALAGGRIDTDAIDNSAGVDTSDHEVNIKILTGMAEQRGELTRPARDALLASMSDSVGDHVLAHNYSQTLALSLLEAEAVQDLFAQGQFMSELEAKGRLDRVLEGLPDAAALATRAAAGKGLTRPELAVLLAYGKLDLFEDVIASRAPDDSYFLATLEGYFPQPVRRFEEDMKRHRLRREIIATVVDDALVDLCGPTFPRRLQAAAGCGVAELIIAFEGARQVLRFAGLWARIEALDGKVPAAAQTALFRELAYVLRGQTYWLARRAAREATGVSALITTYRPAMDALKKLVPAVLSPFEQKAAVRRAAGWIKAGAPKDVAHSVALMRPLTVAATLTDLAAGGGWSLAPTAYVYHRVGGVFGFDRLRAAAGSRAAGDAYERLAVRRLIEDMLAEQAALTGAVMRFAGEANRDEPEAERARGALNAWSTANAEATRAARKTIEDIAKDGGGWSFAKLTIANAALRELAGA